MTDELTFLQTMRLKGRVALDVLSFALDCDKGSVETLVKQAAESGLVASADKGLVLTPVGRARLIALVAAERESVKRALVEELYEEFDGYNLELKEIVTEWQMKSPDSLNDHTDPAYDAAIVADMADLHQRFVPWLERLASVAPRLSRYRIRLDSAMGAVQRGDHGFIAKPIVDSYHTVWFELHEELLGLLGRNRGSEAAAGRAL